MFALQVDGTLSPFKPGTLVYLKAATDGGKPTITFTKAGADVVLGWVNGIYTTVAKDSVYLVVLDPRPVA